MNDGTSLPTVKVLAQGLKLPVYDAMVFATVSIQQQPAWILLDILRRAGWSIPEIDYQRSRWLRPTATKRSMRWTSTEPNHAAQIECNVVLRTGAAPEIWSGRTQQRRGSC